MFRRSSSIGEKEENTYTIVSRVDANGQVLSQQYFGEGLRASPSLAPEINPSVVQLHDKQFQSNRAVAARGLIADIKAQRLTAEQLDFARVASQNPEAKK
jgi:hypothetical protein